LLAKNALILISEHTYDGYLFNFTSRHNAKRLRIHLEDFTGKYSGFYKGLINKIQSFKIPLLEIFYEYEKDPLKSPPLNINRNPQRQEEYNRLASEYWKKHVNYTGRPEIWHEKDCGPECFINANCTVRVYAMESRPLEITDDTPLRITVEGKVLNKNNNDSFSTYSQPPSIILSASVPANAQTDTEHREPIEQEEPNQNVLTTSLTAINVLRDDVAQQIRDMEDRLRSILNIGAPNTPMTKNFTLQFPSFTTAQQYSY
jgi:hypothetical protein